MLVACDIIKPKRLTEVPQEKILSVNGVKYCIVNSSLKVGDKIVYRLQRNLKKEVVIAEANHPHPVTKMASTSTGLPKPGQKRKLQPQSAAVVPKCSRIDSIAAEVEQNNQAAATAIPFSQDHQAALFGEANETSTISLCHLSFIYYIYIYIYTCYLFMLSAQRPPDRHSGLPLADGQSHVMMPRSADTDHDSGHHSSSMPPMLPQPAASQLAQHQPYTSPSNSYQTSQIVGVGSGCESLY